MYHHYSIIQGSFTALKMLCAPLIHPSLSSPATGNHWHFYYFNSFAFFIFLLKIFIRVNLDCSSNFKNFFIIVGLVLPFLECGAVEIMEQVVFSCKVLSLSHMNLSFLHVFPWLDNVFLFSSE